MAEKTPIHLLRLEVTESTNSFLKDLAKRNMPLGAADGTAVCAELQTGGRGRLGHSFEAPKGGVFASYLFSTGLPPEEISTLTFMAAAAVRRAVLFSTGIAAVIKPTNDLLIGGKKFCGILTESFLWEGRMRVIIGVGINSNTLPDDYSPELRGKITTLRAETGKPVDNEALLFAVLKELNILGDRHEADRNIYLKEFKGATNGTIY